MSRYKEGWVKLHRSLYDTPIWKNPIRWALWTRLHLMASWEPQTIVRDGVEISLPPGSVLTSTKELADLVGCDPRTVSKWLKSMSKNSGPPPDLVLKTSALGTIVTITSWADTQAVNEKNSGPNDTCVQLSCIENAYVLRIKKKEEERKTVPRARESEQSTSLVGISNQSSTNGAGVVGLSLSLIGEQDKDPLAALGDTSGIAPTSAGGENAKPNGLALEYEEARPVLNRMRDECLRIKHGAPVFTRYEARKICELMAAGNTPDAIVRAWSALLESSDPWDQKNQTVKYFCEKYLSFAKTRQINSSAEYNSNYVYDEHTDTFVLKNRGAANVQKSL